MNSEQMNEDDYQRTINGIVTDANERGDSDRERVEQPASTTRVYQSAHLNGDEQDYRNLHRHKVFSPCSDITVPKDPNSPSAENNERGETQPKTVATQSLPNQNFDGTDIVTTPKQVRSGSAANMLSVSVTVQCGETSPKAVACVSSQPYSSQTSPKAVRHEEFCRQEQGENPDHVPGLVVAGPVNERRGKRRKRNPQHRGKRNKFPWDSSSRGTTEKEIKAIKEVYEMQLKRREDDLHLQGVVVPLKNIPVVHPEFTKITNFYKGGAAPKEEKYSSTNERLFSTKGETIPFDELCKPDRKSRFTGFVGNPGAGKTTFSKRLVKQKKLMCFLLKYMDLNYKKELTLRELILDKPYPDLEPSTCKFAFQWIKKNQDKCLFVFDGLDQAVWSFDENVSKESYNTKQHVQHLMTNLCNGHFFRDSFLVVTSRPHSMTLIPEFQRPNLIYLLGDLPHDDMKKLFFAYAGKKAQFIWDQLHKTAPILMSLCHNPLMLQLVITACIEKLDQIDEIQTMTKVFSTVLEQLKHSTNVRHDISKIKLQISKLAFNATEAGTVVITVEQLKTVQLDADTVQDLIILLHAAMGVTNKVFDGDTKLYFSHQTYQEYYTAIHIKVSLPLEEFKVFVRSKLYTEHYNVVRRFLFGVMLDISEDVNDEMSEKQRVIKESIIKKLEDFPLKIPDSAEACKLLELWCDIKECNDEELMKKAAELFPPWLCLKENPLDANQVHCFCEIMKRVKKPLDKLIISHCKLNTTLHRLIIDAMMHLDSIGEFFISANKLTGEAVADICRILPKVTKSFRMRACLVNENGAERPIEKEEIHQIQRTLNAMDHWNLEVFAGPGNTLRKRS
ncbi:unnamed protein product [Clavelina lepadiformis]|uniref:NACHT domain-containing protein n=1 Tax=Clavelina lepadiformis TaxID=159417 RepID=A0ABP0GQF9_CLALP